VTDEGSKMQIDCSKCREYGEQSYKNDLAQTSAIHVRRPSAAAHGHC
jgi:hypothetical protein